MGRTANCSDSGGGGISIGIAQQKDQRDGAFGGQIPLDVDCLAEQTGGSGCREDERVAGRKRG
jgi:hypothetical protein